MRSRCPARPASHPASCREIDFARTEEDRRLLLRILVNRCVAVDDRASSGSIRRLINLKARSGSHPAACRHMSNRETASMEIRMSERIRYAWGRSSLGEFIAAASDHGLVAFEFGDRRGAMMEALQTRFPD